MRVEICIFQCYKFARIISDHVLSFTFSRVVKIASQPLSDHESVRILRDLPPLTFFHRIALHFISCLVLYCFVIQCIIVCLAFWFLAFWLKIRFRPIRDVNRHFTGMADVWSPHGREVIRELSRPVEQVRILVGWPTCRAGLIASIPAAAVAVQGQGCDGD